MEKPPQSANVSETVSAIIWSRQLSQKLTSNNKVAQSLFADISSIAKFSSDSNDLCKAIKIYEKQLFEKWIDNIKKALADTNERQKYEMSG
jgi:hypothetical protein